MTVCQDHRGSGQDMVRQKSLPSCTFVGMAAVHPCCLKQCSDLSRLQRPPQIPALLHDMRQYLHVNSSQVEIESSPGMLCLPLDHCDRQECTHSSLVLVLPTDYLVLAERCHMLVKHRRLLYLWAKPELPEPPSVGSLGKRLWQLSTLAVPMVQAWA